MLNSRQAEVWVNGVMIILGIKRVYALEDNDFNKRELSF
jgi:hypothetical protein